MLPADARARLWSRVQTALPEGRALSNPVWWQRHQVLVWVLWGHVAVLTGWWAGSQGTEGTLRGIVLVAFAATIATTDTVRRRVRAVAAAMGLLGCSAVLLHLSGGADEFQFHFFVVLALVALYQDWLPFLVAVGFVLTHDATLGLDGGGIKSAILHGAFIGAAGLVHLLTWAVHERAGAQAEHALSATGEGIYGIDEAGIITFANPAAARMMRTTVADLLGRNHHDAFGHALVGAAHPLADECATCAVIDARTGTAVRDHVFGAWDATTEDDAPSADERSFLVEVASSPIALRGSITGSMVTFRDVTAQAELRRRAYLDPLTGLPNRILLLDHLDESLGRRRRTDQIAVLFLDLDHFKVINDTLGHAAGDALLIGVAQRLRHVVRPSDTVGRLGGDEFVVICEGVTDRDHAAGVAHRVLAGFDEPFDLGRDDPIDIRPSIGVFVPALDATDSPDDLLRKADAAMYRAKQQGRARVQLFDDDEVRAAAR